MTAEDIMAEFLQDVDTYLEGRIFPVTAGQDVARPYIVYRRVNTQPIYTLANERIAERVEIRIDIYGHDANELQETVGQILEAVPVPLLDQGDDRSGFYCWLIFLVWAPQ